MFPRDTWTLLVVCCVLFASPSVHAEIVVVERDANAGLGQEFNSDLTGAMLMAREFDDGSDHESTCESDRHTSTPGSLTTTVTASTCPFLTPQSLPTAICSIATALCAACPSIVVTTTATVSTTVTVCPVLPTTSPSISSSRPCSTCASSVPPPPCPTCSIRYSNSSTTPSSSSDIPSSSSGRPATTATTRSSTPMPSSFSSIIPPRTTPSSPPPTLPPSTEPVRPSSPPGERIMTITRRYPPVIVRREMMGNITAIVTNTTRTFANATTSRPLNLTSIRTTTTTTTTGVFPRFQRARFRD